MVLKEMRAEGSLSSLVTIDCTCALKVIMIYSLVIAREEVEGGVGKVRAREARELIQGVVDVLEGMEQVGFVKSVVGELPQRLDRLGIKREVEDNRPVQESLAQSWAGFDSNNAYGIPATNLQSMEGLGDDNFMVDMDLFMDMDMDVSSMQRTGDLFQPNLDFFSGVFGGFDAL